MKKIKERFFLCGLTFVTTLCIALSILFSTSLQAEELKPFLTLKVASPETLLNVAGKIAELSGTSKDFKNAVAPFKDLAGLNSEGSIGFVLHSDGQELKEPILILPIKDLNAVNLPGFETITTGLKKQSDGKYLLNSPLGNYVFYQKSGYVIVVTEESALSLPNDPKTLIAGLEDYTLGIKIDFENTSLDAIETALAMPQMILAMQGGPQATQAIEQFNEAVGEIYKEVRSLTFGISLDPKTAEVSFVTLTVPRKGSESEQQVTDYKSAKTAFGGFLGGKNVIFSANGVETLAQSDVTVAIGILDQLLDAMVAQIEEQSETDEEAEFGEAIADSARKILAETFKKGRIDLAVSLESDGTLLAAMTLGSTAELEKIAVRLLERAKKNHGDAEVDEFLKKYLKKNAATIEGFNVSTLKIPLAEVAEGHDLPEKLAKETIGLFLATKTDEAVALAFGFDFDKTEKAFHQALSQTKTLVPLKQPMLVIALQPLGQLLKKYTDFDSANDVAAKSIELLVSAGADAKMTGSAEVVDNALLSKFNISGKAITVLANIIKIFAATENTGTLNRSEIKEF
jgi:hypothetical protein